MKSIKNHTIIMIVVMHLITSFESYAQQFAIIGDYRNKTQATAQVAAMVKSWKPDFVITCGDNFDLTAGTIDDQIGQFYSEYIFPYKGVYPIGKGFNRFYPVLGNHELKENGLSLYLDYFTLPGNERYYDFVKGSVHFFMLNSNVFEPDGIGSVTVQALWLKKQLEQSVSTWNIVVLHQPPYSSGRHGSDTTMQWPYAKWGADAVIAGHDHLYERIMQGGIFYFVNGLGGASIYDFADTIPGSEFQYNANYGAQRVFATEKELTFQFYSLKDSLVDSLTVKRINSRVLDPNFTDNGIIYPNPSDGYIRFMVPVTRVIIFNSQGQMVFNIQQQSDSDSQFEVGNLPNGIYYIQFESPSGFRSTRFVKL